MRSISKLTRKNLQKKFLSYRGVLTGGKARGPSINGILFGMLKGPNSGMSTIEVFGGGEDWAFPPCWAPTS